METCIKIVDRNVLTLDRSQFFGVVLQKISGELRSWVAPIPTHPNILVALHACNHTEPLYD